jgi:hypothetical protein
MITELVSDDNNSYKLPLIKLVETKNMMVLTREEKRRLVLDLYNQGRTYREIAKEARISTRDIGHILRKTEQNNQRPQQEDSGRNGVSASWNESLRSFRIQLRFFHPFTNCMRL